MRPSPGGDKPGVARVVAWRAIAKRHTFGGVSARSFGPLVAVLHRKITKLAQTTMVRVSHNDVIQHFDFQELPGSD